MTYLFKLLIYFYLIILISTSCANRKSPTGGPKDEEGPKLVKTIPEDKSINFKGKELYFEFNEYVKEDNFTDKVIISPSIDSTFTYKIVKKKLNLEFLAELKDSTTYTINLGEAIKDITESNSGINLQLTFSTGNFIDSLSINGKLHDINTGKGMENLLVGIFEATDTLTIFNSKPKYIARSDKEGKFNLQNIRKDRYLLYAWNDRDKNLMYTNQTEVIGFVADTLDLTTNISDLKIPIQKFDLRKTKITRQENKEDVSTIEFNKGLTNFSIKIKEDTTKKLLYTLSKEMNKISIFNTLNFNDSIEVRTIAKDSFDIKVDTTFRLIFSQKEEDKKTNKKNKQDERQKRFTLKINPSNNQILKTEEVSIYFDNPIKKYSLDTFYFYKDSLTTYPIQEKEISWNENMTRLNINKKIDIRDTIKFKSGFSTFIDVTNDSSQVSDQHFVKKTSDKFSSIGGTVNIKEKDFIVQIENKDGSFRSQLIDQRNFKFDFLEPGTYIIKVLIDSNNNGIWDKGDLKKRIEPERIIYFKILDNKGKETNEITIKANWELLENEITDSE